MNLEKNEFFEREGFYYHNDHLVCIGNLNTKIGSLSTNGIFKHEWAGEIVVIMGLVHYNITAVPFYRVMCHRGSMIVSVNDLNIIS